MIHLTYAQRTEDLLDVLARDLEANGRGRHPLDPVRLVLPDRNLEAWLKQGLARRMGIAANLQVLYLGRLVGGLLEAAGLPPLLDGDAIFDVLLSIFLEPETLDREELAPVRRYLFAAGAEESALARRRHQLARRLSHLYEEYGYARPAMLQRWEREPTAGGSEVERWQRALWLLSLERRPDRISLPALLDRLHELPAPEDPVYLFGISHVAHAFHRILARLAEGGELFVYTLNPCKEFWEDLPTVREARRGLRVLEEADPYGLSGGGETPPLSLWGRPGRENIRLLNELSGCDFREAFSEPPPPPRTLLSQIQADILERHPERTAPDPSFNFAGDRSIEVIEAPGIRREAEAVARRIWELVSEDDSLRFNEIGVAVAAREPELHFSHLVAAFEESFDIPYSLTDVRLSEQSEVARAVGMLLDLLDSRFERARMLGFLTHPCVASRFPEVDPETWVALVDRLGIFLGAERADLEGTYVREDALNWDQGLRRLALGVVLPGGRTAEAEPVAFHGDRYLPEETEEEGLEFGALVRSLISDLRFGMRARFTTETWARYFDALGRTYVVPRNDRERRHLDRCLAALRSVAEHPLDGKPISCAQAVEIARDALAELPGGVGRYLSEGVAISTLRPMRAIPFRVLFVVGLGEGLFPTPERRDPLDLRQLRFQPGDVSPRERDQYMFLEALLCAREKLVLSYVGRDEQTGDPIPPSPVLGELLEMVEKGYTGSRETIVTRIPLRRWAEEGSFHPAPPAAGERWAASLYERMCAATGRARFEVEEIAARAPEPQRGELLDRLGLVSLPNKGGSELRVLQLHHLRRFLECPIQGSTTALLGLGDDDEDLAGVENERLELDPPTCAALVRETMGRWLSDRDGKRVEEVWEERIYQRQVRGEAPLGEFGRLAELEALAEMRLWADELSGQRSKVRVYRFGPGREFEAVDEILPLLDLGGERPPLGGRTSPILEDGACRTSLLFRYRRTGSWKGWIRAFLDHVLLSAAGLEASHGVYGVERTPAGAATEVFRSLSRERALAYLRDLVDDLLTGPHELYLPHEACFEWKAKAIRNPGARLVDEIEAFRDERKFPSSTYGPVRFALSYPVPSEEEARAIAGRRFGLLFELLGAEPGAKEVR